MDHPMSHPGSTIARQLRQIAHAHPVFLPAARPDSKSGFSNCSTPPIMQGRAPSGRKDVARAGTGRLPKQPAAGVAMPKPEAHAMSFPPEKLDLRHKDGFQDI